ncbi:MAG: hypothetical protein EBZ48_06300 [Proteobacteria bacterium]|nr:hypothetical protein [Pseudomonadota bacterium]
MPSSSGPKIQASAATKLFTRRVNRLIAGLALAALSYLFLPIKHPPTRIQPPEPVDSRRALEATTLEVIDGDTLLVRIQSRVEKVRLIGIDSPEAYASEKLSRDAKHSGQSERSIITLGQKASQFTRSVIPPGTTIRITFDRKKVDSYGRLLGYVFLPNGSMLNEVVVSSGFATARNYPPNLKYSTRLEEAQESAQQNQRGLWGRADHRVLDQSSTPEL